MGRLEARYGSMETFRTAVDPLEAFMAFYGTVAHYEAWGLDSKGSACPSRACRPGTSGASPFCAFLGIV